jgi:EAL and modified HD-GYP domain-containing signal transduction protein
VGLFSFLKPKSGPERAAPVTAEPPPAAIPGDPALALVSRTAIADQQGGLGGYRYAQPADAVLPEPEFFATLLRAGVPELARQRLAMVDASVAAVSARLHAPLATPNTIFLLDRAAETGAVGEIAAAMASLRAGGSQVALANPSLAPDDAPLMAVCDIALMHLDACPLPEFQKRTRHLRIDYPLVKLAVDGITSWDEQRMCGSLYSQYFLGPYLMTADRPTPEAQVEPSRQTTMELLNLLRTDAELASLIEVAKRDPGMAFQLLQWANAAGASNLKVSSLNQAFLVLGRDQLYRVLTVSMFRLGSAARRARDESLLEIALTRARFLETVQPDLPQAKRDQLFLVGMLSLFEALLGIPMPALLGRMQLAGELKAALLDKAGPYGPYLSMAQLLERDKMEPATVLAESLGIAKSRLGAVAASAFAWAREALKSTKAA